LSLALGADLQAAIWRTWTAGPSIIDVILLMGQPILVKSLMAIIAIICVHAEHVSGLVGLDGTPWDSRGLLVACNLNDVSVHQVGRSATLRLPGHILSTVLLQSCQRPRGSPPRQVRDYR
jgi:hypothetical protein